MAFCAIHIYTYGLVAFLKSALRVVLAFAAIYVLDILLSLVKLQDSPWLTYLQS